MYNDIIKKYPEIQYDENTYKNSTDTLYSETIIRYATIVDNKPFFVTYVFDNMKIKHKLIDKNKIKNILKDDLIISVNKYLNFDQILKNN